MDKERISGPNYEAEYNRLLERHEQLRAKHMELEREFKALEVAYARVDAQMEIVHLIFGRR